MPALCAIAAPVAPLSPVMTWTVMPAWCACSIALGTASRTGSESATKPKRVRPISALWRSSGTFGVAGRASDQAQPLAGQLLQPDRRASLALRSSGTVAPS